VLNNYVLNYYKGYTLLLQLILICSAPQIILKHKLIVDGAMIFGRYGDTDCPKQNNQAAGSPKCHISEVRNLDTHPFKNPRLTLINNLPEQFVKAIGQKGKTAGKPL
jgi:hypothetical protein